MTNTIDASTNYSHSDGSNMQFHFYFGITSKRAPSSVKGTTFTISELLAGKRVHHCDDEGVEGWIEIFDGQVATSWSIGSTGGSKVLPLLTWIDRLKNAGTDFNAADPEYC